MKRLLVLGLFTAVAALAQTGVKAPICVTYTLVNSATVPESGSYDAIGLLVVVSSTDQQLGKFDVHVVYVDPSGIEKTAAMTVSRKITRAGYDTLPLMVAFSDRMSRIIAVIAYGYSSDQNGAAEIH